MYRSILLPLDGSSSAEAALPIACAWASRAQAALHLVHVHAPSALAPIHIAGLPVIDEQLHPRSREHEQGYLERIKMRLATSDPHVSVKTAVVDGSHETGRDASIAYGLAHYAEANGCDLIVMTTHGRGGFSRFWLGSVAAALTAIAHQPIVFVRLPPLERDRDAAVVRRMLIPLDGSALAEQIIEPAARLGNLLQSDYTLLHVVEPLIMFGPAPFTAGTDLDPEGTQEQVEDARAHLEQVAEPLRALGVNVQVLVKIAEHPAKAILNVALEHNIDLIAMATHGRSGLSRLVVGSVADKVLRGTELPMLLYRPQQ